MESLILDHALSLFTVISLTLVSLFSFNGIIKEKPFTSLLICVSSFAFLIAATVSYNLVYGNYLVYMFYGVSLLIFIYKIFKDRSSFFKFLRNNSLFVIFATAAGLVSLVYLFINLNVTFLYSALDPYFYGIPYEIIEGGYSSRIKIWDNYPVTWSKYHFFPGSFAAIFLFFAGLKNIFLYKFYKLLIIVFMFFVFEENLKKNIRSQFYKTLLFSIPIVMWLISTNGTLPILFLFLSISLYLNKNVDYGLLFLLFFASSLSRHVFPGVVLFVLLGIYNYKFLIRSKVLFLLPLPLLNIVAMTFSGHMPTQLYSPGQEEFIYNFLYGRGGSFLFQNQLYNIYDVTIVNQVSLSSLIYFLPLIFFLIIIKKHKASLVSLIPLLILGTSVILQILFQLEPNSGPAFGNYSKVTQTFFLLNATMTFYYPYYVFKKFCHNKTVFYILLLFYALSLLNMIVIPSSGPKIHYVFIDLIVVFFLCQDIKLRLLSFRKSFLILGFMIIILIPINNSSQYYIEPPSGYFKIDEVDTVPLEYRRFEEKDDLILESNIYGRRINYYENSDEQYHLSKQFLSPD
tara:strand:- start:548 stop:2260 length:1713 start_codon:yes stop_codon:yes gene_type:complete